MASVAERALYNHLTNPDSLDILAREGFNLAEVREIIPSEFGRSLVEWCLGVFFEGGRTVAPSREAIRETYDSPRGNVLDDNEIVIDDESEEQSIQWAITELRGRYLRDRIGTWNVTMLQDVYTAEPQHRVQIATDHYATLGTLLRKSTTRRYETTGSEGVDAAIARLEQRIALGSAVDGMTLGVPEIDEHTMGVRKSEIAVIAGGTASGKSMTSTNVWVESVRNGRRIGLATLENDVDMTFDRIVCMAARVSYRDFQRGTLTPMQRQLIDMYAQQIKESDCVPLVTTFRPDEATVNRIVRWAQLEGVEELVIDQVSFLHTEMDSKAVARKDELREIMGGLHEMLKYEYRIPCLVLNQINRDGVKNARKNGRFYAQDLAEGSWVENTASFVFAIYQSELMRREQIAQFQQLKGRRTDLKHFELDWRPEVGDFRYRREVTFEDE